MVRCYICNRENARPLLVEENDVNLDRIQNIARLHRNRFGLNEINIEDDSRLCLNCKARINKVIEMEDQDSIILEVLIDHGTLKCFICHRDCRFRINMDARIDFYVKTNIYLPNETRCCRAHLTDNGLIQLQFMDNHISIPLGVHMTGPQALEWFQKLREYALKASSSKFEDEANFDDEDFKSITSITKRQFQELYNYCGPVQYCGHLKNVTKKHLITFLMKMRQGLSDAFIKSLLNYSSRQNVSMAVSIARQSLMTRFVLENLGFRCPEVQNREHFIANHVTRFSNILYNPTPEIPRAILYPDCTYLKCPKSANFRIQRQSYSYHKKYTLLKAGLVVASDGYIIDVHGPYFSDCRNNDAAILIHDISRDQQILRAWVQEGDIFVVDRGYRDAVEFLEEFNLNCEIPPFLPHNQRQFTTAEANRSRIITKTRWIVESRNGHLKSIFKLFRDMIPMQHCEHLSSFLKIACALINKFHEPIHMQDESEELAQRMLEIKNRDNINLLQNRVEQEQLLRTRGQGMWLNMQDNDLQEFPRLNYEYLRLKTLGSYQVKLSPGYIQDTTSRNVNNEFVFQTQLYEPGLIRARVYSRFTQSVKHFIFISYTEVQNAEPISGTYCTCKMGARTVGVCAHVASLLWYLGYARHEENVSYPSCELLRVVLDAVNREHNVID